MFTVIQGRCNLQSIQELVADTIPTRRADTLEHPSHP